MRHSRHSRAVYKMPWPASTSSTPHGLGTGSNASNPYQEHLAAFRGRIESLTFLYSVPGFAGDSRLYLIRRGRLQREFPYPTTEGERREIDDAVESVYRAPDQGPASLAPQDAAEILLVARWFELHPKELKLSATPKKWLAEGGIRPSRRRTERIVARTGIGSQVPR